MANAKWDDLKAKAFFAFIAFLIIGLLSLITGEGDPVDAIWGGFWLVAGVVGSISLIVFMLFSLKKIFKSK